jgi:hypothetical protein
MNPRVKAAARSAIYVSLLGALLSVTALIGVISQSGDPKASMFCTVLVYLGYWPMLATGWSTHNLFASFWLLPVNLIGWSVVGLVVGWFRAGEP